MTTPLRLKDGHVRAFMRDGTALILAADQYQPMLAAWTSGKAFQQFDGFYGSTITIKLAEVNAVSLSTADAYTFATRTGEVVDAVLARVPQSGAPEGRPASRSASPNAEWTACESCGLGMLTTDLFCGHCGKTNVEATRGIIGRMPSEGLIGALAWALDMMVRYESRLKQFGDSARLVHSDVHEAARAKARAALSEAEEFVRAAPHPLGRLRCAECGYPALGVFDLHSHRHLEHRIPLCPYVESDERGARRCLASEGHEGGHLLAVR